MFSLIELLLLLLTLCINCSFYKCLSQSACKNWYKGNTIEENFSRPASSHIVNALVAVNSNIQAVKLFFNKICWILTAGTNKLRLSSVMAIKQYVVIVVVVAISSNITVLFL